MTAGMPGPHEADRGLRIALHLAPEPGAVGHDEPEVPHLRRVHPRPVDLVEDAVADREPDPAGVVGGADGVLGAARPGGGESRRARRLAGRGPVDRVVRPGHVDEGAPAGAAAGACQRPGRGTSDSAAAGPHVPRAYRARRAREIQDGVDDPPGGLHGVLAGEQHLVTLGRVGDEALIGRQLGPAVVGGIQLDLLTDHAPRRDAWLARRARSTCPASAGIGGSWRRRAPARRRRRTEASSARPAPPWP